MPTTLGIVFCRQGYRWPKKPLGLPMQNTNCSPLCLVSAVASYVSSLLLCWALCCHQCHYFLCLLSITVHAVLCSCLIIIVAAITLCASSLSPYTPCPHHLVPLVAIALHAASLLPCTPCCHCPVHCIAITLHPLLPLPCTPHHYHPMCHIAIALCPLSLLPCTPCCHCPMLLIAIALCPLLPLPCTSRHHHPAPLILLPYITFGSCASLATLMPVLVVFWTKWSLRAYCST